MSRPEPQYDWIRPGVKVWYESGFGRYAGVVAGEVWYLGNSAVVRLEEMDKRYQAENKRSSVSCAAFWCLAPRVEVQDEQG